MPPFRMPFGRKPQNASGNVDENMPPSVILNGPYGEKARPSTISIRSQRSEPEELELGVVDDNGTYLPPSPPERRSMWRRTPTSTTTTSSHMSVVSDNEGFSISRESFDSYRRSFDISARSPVIHPESTYSRQSLDSLRTPYTPRSMRQASAKSFESSRTGDVNTVDEEETDTFEDVGLEDAKPQRKGIFSRFIKEDSPSDAVVRPASGHRGFHLPGRRRGQSGQGSELGDMPRFLSNKPSATEQREERSTAITA